MSSAEVGNCGQNLAGINWGLGFVHKHDHQNEAHDNKAQCARGNDGKPFIGCDPGKHSNNRPKWRGAEGVEIQTGRAVPRPLQAARYVL